MGPHVAILPGTPFEEVARNLEQKDEAAVDW